MKIILCTGPSLLCQEMATAVVKEQLAACVNIIPTIKSIYFWQGELCNDEESLMICKTTNEMVSALCYRLKQLHSYEVPEIITLEVDENTGNKDYFNWIKDSVKKHC